MEIELHSPEQLDELKKAFEADPQNIHNTVRLAQYYCDIGWFNESLKMFEQLLSEHSEEYSVSLEYGNLCFKRQDYTKALELFATVTRLRPQRIEGWNNLGIAQMKCEAYEDAHASFQKVIELEPGNIGALLNLGNYHSHQGDHEKAIECFLQVVKKHPDLGDGWFNLGNEHLALDQLNDAVSTFEKAIRFMPESASAHKNLGFVFERQNKFEKAQKEYSTAIQYAKADAALYINLGNVSMQLKQYDEAKEQYLRAVKLSPRELAGWMGLRHLALLKGDIDAFVKSTAAVLYRLEPDTIADSIAVLRGLQQFEKAATLVSMADQLGKRSDLFDAERMLAYARIDCDDKKALAIFEALHSISQPAHSIRICCAEYSLLQKDFEGALEILAGLLPGTIREHQLLWSAQIGSGQYAQAQAAIKVYLADDPESPEAWFDSARVSALTDNSVDASGHLRTALELGFSDIDSISKESALSRVYGKIIHLQDSDSA